MIAVRHRGWTSILLFLLVLIGYVALALRTAAATPLTYDEVYTVYLSQFSTPDQLWGWLRAGTDLNPPLNYLLTHLAFQAFGTSPLTARVPSVAAYGGALFCTFIYLRRRHRSEAAGWLGGLALLACNLPYYAVIARAYALMLFWGAAALLTWYCAYKAATPRRRMVAALGLGGILAAGIYTHYYSVFIIVSLAIAEAIRLGHTGRVNKMIVLALLAGVVAGGTLFPLVQTARGFSNSFWRRPSWGDIELCYGNILLNFAVPIFIVAGTAYALRLSRWSGEPEPTDRVADAATISFLAIPIVGLTLAMLGTGAFDKRYVILGYLGAVGVFAGLAAPALRASSLATGFVLFVLGGWWLLGTELRYRNKIEEARQFKQTVSGVREFAANSPVCYAIEPGLYLPLAFAAPDLRDRLVYPSDPQMALEFTRSDTDDRNLIQLARTTSGLAVRPFTECPLPIGAVVIGDAWQKVAWERAGYRFESGVLVGSKTRTFKVIARPR